MKPPPAGWPRIAASVYYEEAREAIDWLVRAFGFTLKFKVEGPDGSIHHSQLELPGDGLLMVGQAGLRPERAHCRSPRSLEGANTQGLAIHVDDVDAHCASAREAGATIASEPSTQDYGEEYWCDRCYEAVDPEGHHWWFMQRMKTKGVPEDARRDSTS